MSARRHRNQPNRMKVLQDNFFKYSNSRLTDERGLEDERRRLSEEQKLSRARVRIMTMETNRRRRALEERQTEWNMQQKQMRENILLQRRQQIQDATERFQRAHLPPSQRYRQDFRKNVPDIEDALNHIQGKLGSTKRQSFFLSSNSNISRSHTPSAKPPSKVSHRQTRSAVEISSKPIPEQSTTSFNHCQQTEKSQDKQDKLDYRPQGNTLFLSSDSDSISSTDSLEYEDPNPTRENLQSFHSSFLLGLEKPFLSLEQNKQSDLCPTTDLTSFSDKMLHGDNLTRSSKLHEQKMQEDSESTNNDLHTSKASWEFKAVEQMSRQKALSDSINNLNKDLNLELKIESLVNTVSQQHACHEVSTEITTEKSINIASQERPCYTVSTELQTEQSNNIESQQHTYLYNIQADIPKCPEKDVPVQKLPVSVGPIHSILHVRFVKGILKQQSQHMSGSHMCVYGSEHFMFPEQVALTIRDSVEITKEKPKGLESTNTYKKKLRWFDEEHEDNEDRKQDMTQQMNYMSSHLCQSSNNLDGHQQSLTTVSHASKPVHDTGNHITKQTTADVGIQVNLPQERVEEVKLPCSSNRTDDLKVPQRECFARVGPGPVLLRTRRGTILRPVSATEMNQIAKTHGKLKAPRPPPNKELVDGRTTNITKFPYHSNVNSEQALDLDQAVYKKNSEDLFSQDTNNVIKTVSGSNTKGNSSLAHQETQSCTRGSRMVYFKNGLHLDRTPTDEEISLLWKDVRSVLSTKDVTTLSEKNKLRSETTESEHFVRKSNVKQSTQTPGSGHKSLPQLSQSIRLTSDPVLSSFCMRAFPDEALKSKTQLHLEKEHAEGFLEEKDDIVTREMQQTKKPVKMQQNCNRRGLTTISMEEQRVLLSLDRLNHQLLCVQDCMGVNNGLTRDVKIQNHHKHCASPPNNCSGYKKKE
ncbi:centrosomal protein of 126 kDa isoform X2 [Antennarius striatus]